MCGKRDALPARPLHKRPFFGKSNERRSVITGIFERRNQPQRVEPRRHLRLFSVGNDGPRKLVGSEIFGNRNGEEAPPPASEKVRGLSLIGTARLDSIVGPDGNIRLLLEILVGIPKQRTDR